MSAPSVKILATCRSLELIEATKLVFRTLRVGYPTAHVEVFLNNITNGTEGEIVEACEQARVDTITRLDYTTIHHVWIESLVEKLATPFILLDTDIVFWRSCEEWSFHHPLAGHYMPDFNDEFTGCLTKNRLHGSHMWIRPAEVRESVASYKATFPVTPFNPPPNLFYPCYLPFRNAQQEARTLFFDTACLLYQAIGGDKFERKHLDAYNHLHSGTISDLVSPRLKGASLRETHFAIFENLQLARGLWEQERRYLTSRGAVYV